MADSITNTKKILQNSPKKLLFVRQFYTLYEPIGLFLSFYFLIWDHFFPYVSPKDSKIQIVWTFDFRNWGKKYIFTEWFFFRRGDFRPFMNKRFQIWDHFFLLLFPKDFKNLKCLDIGLREFGATRLLNGVRKCDGQTNRQTYGHFNL